MRTVRSGVAFTLGALVSALLAAPLSMAAQQEQPADVGESPSLRGSQWYPSTLNFGTGLVDIPVAWVSPRNGDLWLNVGGRDIPATPSGSSLNFSQRWNTNLALDTHWLGRISAGFSLYSQNPEWGFFGQALLLKERQGSPLPAVAIGVRNLGSYTHEDRLLLGHDVKIDSSGQFRGITSAYARKFDTSPTVYGVVTKSFAAGSGWGSVTAGYGSGLFFDDGGLKDAYNDKGQVVKGLFFGGQYTFQLTPNSSLKLMGENNGWDFNAGAVGEWRGLSLGLYGTELEEGGKSPSKGPLYQIYNYAKFNVTLGYSSNIYDIASGSILRSQVAQMQREQLRLRAELAQRQKRIEALEIQLRKAQAGELAEVAKRREQLESQIQDEREAIRRAEERLQQLQQGTAPAPQPPPPPAPPGGTPPTR